MHIWTFGRSGVRRRLQFVECMNHVYALMELRTTFLFLDRKVLLFAHLARWRLPVGHGHMELMIDGFC